MSKDKKLISNENNAIKFIFDNGIELDVLRQYHYSVLYKYFPRDVALVKTIKMKRVRF